MRILQVVDFYPPVIGGMERHVQTLAHELAKRGHHSAVVTLWHDQKPAFEIDDAGMRIYRIKGWNRVLSRFYEDSNRHFHLTMPDPGVMKQLLRVIDEERPDIIHAHGWILYSLLQSRPRLRALLAVTLHDHGLVCVKKTYMRHDQECDGPAFAKCMSCAIQHYGMAKGALLTSAFYANKRLHHRADLYLAISRSVKEISLSGVGNPPRPVVIVPTMTPDVTFDPSYRAVRPAFLPPDDNYLLFVGQLSKHKGVDVLLDAYQRSGVTLPLVMIGTEYGSVRREFPPHVTVMRNVPHHLVMGAWAHALFGIVPSLWPEPFGQVVVEAMACGKAVIASNIGGLRDVVSHGETGILVPPGNAEALARAIGRLVSDPELRVHLGRVGPTYAEQFQGSRVAAAVEHVFFQLLAQHQVEAV